MPPYDVIVCGSLHLDVLVYAPALPRPDETVTGKRWERKCGGKGGNQAVMAARAGARTAMIGRVGADEFGSALRAHLQAAGVETAAVDTDVGVGSGMSAAIVQDDGDYGAVIVSGANLRIDPAQAAQEWGALGGARVLLLQNEIPEPVNIAAAAAARDACVVLNAAPMRAISEALLSQIGVLVVNRVEAGMLVGGEVTNRDNALAALPKLAPPGRDVVITLGGSGVVVAPAGVEPIWIAPKSVVVVSSHGAGDCFVGAMASRLASGESLLEACNFANSAAADYVAGLG